VEEDGRDDARIGQKREDLHVGAAGGTQKRQDIVDAREQDGPADSGRGGALGRQLGGRGGWSDVYSGRRRLG